jgi:aminomethyltransferase
MVVNASNRQKILAWLTDHRAAGSDVQIQDETQATAMIAVQGPHALAIAERVVGSLPLSSLKYYRAAWLEEETNLLLVSRTGYTGEDGVELVARRESAVDLWRRLMSVGESMGIRAAGLGARDTLRLEAAMPLYGHELSEAITPIQAGLDFAVDLEDRTFPGIDAIRQQRSNPGLPRRVGLSLGGKRVPRQHYRVRSAHGEDVGEVTSGTFSPTLARPLAMAYVQPGYDQPGSRLSVDVRGQLEPATVVALPFYQRRKSATMG